MSTSQQPPPGGSNDESGAATDESRFAGAADLTYGVKWESSWLDLDERTVVFDPLLALRTIVPDTGSKATGQNSTSCDLPELGPRLAADGRPSDPVLATEFSQETAENRTENVEQWVCEFLSATSCIGLPCQALTERRTQILRNVVIAKAREFHRLLSVKHAVRSGKKNTGGSYLVLGAESASGRLDDVRQKLISSGVLQGCVIDTYNANKEIPPPEMLGKYRAILVFNNSRFKDNTQLGNYLADYVDKGGGVIMHVYTCSNSSGTNRLGGRWHEQNYNPICPNSNKSVDTVMTIGKRYHPDHPVMDGVKEVSGKCTHSNGEVHNMAKLICEWSNGRPLVCELEPSSIRKIGGSATPGRVMAINFYPPSSDLDAKYWNKNTQGAILMANALVHCSSEDVQSSDAKSAPIMDRVGILSLFRLVVMLGKDKLDYTLPFIRTFVSLVEQNPLAMKNESPAPVNAFKEILTSILDPSKCSSDSLTIHGEALSAFIALAVSSGSLEQILECVSVLLKYADTQVLVSSGKFLGGLAEARASESLSVLGSAALLDHFVCEDIHFVGPVFHPLAVPICTDRRFVYLICTSGFLKIGTGREGSIRGHVYQRRKPPCVMVERCWMVRLGDYLYVSTTAETAAEYDVYRCSDLSMCGGGFKLPLASMSENEPAEPEAVPSEEDRAPYPFVEIISLTGEHGVVSHRRLHYTSVSSFNTARASATVSAGRWYFECTILTGGIMQIGWATSKFSVEFGNGEGVGDCSHSWAYDGFRKTKWHKGEAPYGTERKWLPRDVVGCLLDLEARTMSFTLNGVDLGVAYSELPEETYMPAISSSEGCAAAFNFGGTPFQYNPPSGFKAMQKPSSGHLVSLLHVDEQMCGIVHRPVADNESKLFFVRYGGATEGDGYARTYDSEMVLDIPKGEFRKVVDCIDRSNIYATSHELVMVHPVNTLSADVCSVRVYSLYDGVLLNSAKLSNKSLQLPTCYERSSNTLWSVCSASREIKGWVNNGPSRRVCPEGSFDPKVERMPDEVAAEILFHMGRLAQPLQKESEGGKGPIADASISLPSCVEPTNPAVYEKLISIIDSICLEGQKESKSQSFLHDAATSAMKLLNANLASLKSEISGNPAGENARAVESVVSKVHNFLKSFLPRLSMQVLDTNSPLRSVHDELSNLILSGCGVLWNTPEDQVQLIHDCIEGFPAGCKNSVFSPVITSQVLRSILTQPRTMLLLLKKPDDFLSVAKKVLKRSLTSSCGQIEAVSKGENDVSHEMIVDSDIILLTELQSMALRMAMLGSAEEVEGWRKVLVEYLSDLVASCSQLTNPAGAGDFLNVHVSNTLSSSMYGLLLPQYVMSLCTGLVRFPQDLAETIVGLLTEVVRVLEGQTLQVLAGTQINEDGDEVDLSQCCINVSSNTPTLFSLIDGNRTTYWKSTSRARTHHILLCFPEPIQLGSVSLLLNYPEDKSYTPRQLAVHAGTDSGHLAEVGHVTLKKPEGWSTLFNVKGSSERNVLASIIKITILENHDGGMDTRVRGVRVMRTTSSGSGLELAKERLVPHWIRELKHILVHAVCYLSQSIISDLAPLKKANDTQDTESSGKNRSVEEAVDRLVGPDNLFERCSLGEKVPVDDLVESLLKSDGKAESLRKKLGLAPLMSADKSVAKSLEAIENATLAGAVHLLSLVEECNSDGSSLNPTLSKVLQRVRMTSRWALRHTQVEIEWNAWLADAEASEDSFVERYHGDMDILSILCSMKGVTLNPRNAIDAIKQLYDCMNKERSAKKSKASGKGDSDAGTTSDAGNSVVIRLGERLKERVRLVVDLCLPARSSNERLLGEFFAFVQDKSFDPTMFHEALKVRSERACWRARGLAAMEKAIVVSSCATTRAIALTSLHNALMYDDNTGQRDREPNGGTDIPGGAGVDVSLSRPKAHYISGVSGAGIKEMESLSSAYGSILSKVVEIIKDPSGGENVRLLALRAAYFDVTSRDVGLLESSGLIDALVSVTRESEDTCSPFLAWCAWRCLSIAVVHILWMPDDEHTPSLMSAREKVGRHVVRLLITEQSGCQRTVELLSCVTKSPCMRRLLKEPATVSSLLARMDNVFVAPLLVNLITRIVRDSLGSMDSASMDQVTVPDRENSAGGLVKWLLSAIGKRLSTGSDCQGLPICTESTAAEEIIVEKDSNADRPGSHAVMVYGGIADLTDFTVLLARIVSMEGYAESNDSDTNIEELAVTVVTTLNCGMEAPPIALGTKAQCDEILKVMAEESVQGAVIPSQKLPDAYRPQDSPEDAASTAQGGSGAAARPENCVNAHLDESQNSRSCISAVTSHAMAAELVAVVRALVNSEQSPNYAKALWSETGEALAVLNKKLEDDSDCSDACMRAITCLAVVGGVPMSATVGSRVSVDLRGGRKVLGHIVDVSVDGTNAHVVFDNDSSSVHQYVDLDSSKVTIEQSIDMAGHVVNWDVVLPPLVKFLQLSTRLYESDTTMDLPSDGVIMHHVTLVYVLRCLKEQIGGGSIEDIKFVEERRVIVEAMARLAGRMCSPSDHVVQCEERFLRTYEFMSDLRRGSLDLLESLTEDGSAVAGGRSEGHIGGEASSDLMAGRLLLAQPLIAMGFPEDKCLIALERHHDNAEAAVNWLLSNADDGEETGSELVDNMSSGIVGPEGSLPSEHAEVFPCNTGDLSLVGSATRLGAADQAKLMEIGPLPNLLSIHGLSRVECPSTVEKGTRRTVVADVTVSSGLWYYEVVVLDGCDDLSVGWCSVAARETEGIVDIGSAPGSWGYDFLHRIKRHCAAMGDKPPVEESLPSALGSEGGKSRVLGIGIDLNAGTINYFVNGSAIGVSFSIPPAACKDGEKPGSTTKYHPAITFGGPGDIWLSLGSCEPHYLPQHYSALGGPHPPGDVGMRSQGGTCLPDSYTYHDLRNDSSDGQDKGKAIQHFWETEIIPALERWLNSEFSALEMADFMEQIRQQIRQNNERDAHSIVMTLCSGNPPDNIRNLLQRDVDSICEAQSTLDFRAAEKGQRVTVSRKAREEVSKKAGIVDWVPLMARSVGRAGTITQLNSNKHIVLVRFHFPELALVDEWWFPAEALRKVSGYVDPYAGMRKKEAGDQLVESARALAGTLARQNLLRLPLEHELQHGTGAVISALNLVAAESLAQPSQVFTALTTSAVPPATVPHSDEVIDDDGEGGLDATRNMPAGVQVPALSVRAMVKDHKVAIEMMEAAIQQLRDEKAYVMENTMRVSPETHPDVFSSNSSKNLLIENANSTTTMLTFHRSFYKCMPTGSTLTLYRDEACTRVICRLHPSNIMTPVPVTVGASRFWLRWKHSGNLTPKEQAGLTIRLSPVSARFGSSCLVMASILTGEHAAPVVPHEVLKSVGILLCEMIDELMQPAMCEACFLLISMLVDHATRAGFSAAEMQALFDRATLLAMRDELMRLYRQEMRAHKKAHQSQTGAPPQQVLFSLYLQRLAEAVVCLIRANLLAHSRRQYFSTDDPNKFGGDISLFHRSPSKIFDLLPFDQETFSVDRLRSMPKEDLVAVLQNLYVSLQTSSDVTQASSSASPSPAPVTPAPPTASSSAEPDASSAPSSESANTQQTPATPAPSGNASENSAATNTGPSPPAGTPRTPVQPTSQAFDEAVSAEPSDDVLSEHIPVSQQATSTCVGGSGVPDEDWSFVEKCDDLVQAVDIGSYFVSGDRSERLSITIVGDCWKATQRECSQGACFGSISEATESLSKWSMSMDEELMEYLEQCLRVRKEGFSVSSPEDLATQMNLGLVLELTDADRARFRSLQNQDHRSMTLRSALIRMFNSSLMSCLPFIDLTQSGRYGSIAYYVTKCRRLLLSSIKTSFLMKIIDRTSHDAKRPSIAIDRIEVAALRAQGSPTEGAVPTYFSLAFDQLWDVPPSRLRPLRPMGAEPFLAFEVQFQKENVVGEGGPYRQFFSDISKELHEYGGKGSPLPLVIPCPNSADRAAAGLAGDGHIPVASSVQPTHICMFEFLGRLMGIALRTGAVLPIDMAPIFWKKLVGERVTRADLANVDRSVLETARFLRECGKEEFEAVIDQNFVVSLSDGTEQELIENGQNVPVTYERRMEFAAGLERARLHEFDLQVSVIRKGLAQIVPSVLLSLCHWEDLRRLVCGDVRVDLELLRRHTEYGGEVTAESQHVEYFWKALNEFSEHERRLFLRFCWAQERLPSSDAEFERTRTRMLIKPGPKEDNALPKADTCFFNLELPLYSSPEVMKRQLLFAINTDSDSMDADDPQGGFEAEEEE